MSILPIQAQGSTSSSSFDSISPNPNSNHGSPLSPSQSSSSLSRQFESMQLSDSQSPTDASGSLASAAEDFSGSSRKVNGTRRHNGRKTFQQKNGETHLQSHLSIQGVGSAQGEGKESGKATSPQGQQSNSPSQGGIPQYGRRAQAINANHLLNFHYDPIARPQPRAPPPRRQQKIKSYNKDLFLQANYKFVVLDTGNHAPELRDPDKRLRWEDIICVRYATPLPVQCPICLEYPLCPQITSCGHIFCFPCILQYLLMGKEDYKGDCFKRCPLCFVMISQKELYTIYIVNVNQYSVGDTIDFMLLTRQKDSFTPSQKIKSQMDMVLSFNNDIYDPFSKFTFTSDVELSVREAISDLDSWLAKVHSGLVDDLEKLPYVRAAMEQLKQRKKYWNEQRICNMGGDYKDSNSQKQAQELLSTENVNCAYQDSSSCRSITQSVDVKDGDKGLDVKLDIESLEDQESILSSSYDKSKSLPKISSGSRCIKENDLYNFYQAVDGQHLILHPLNMKCLLHHYGNYEMLPHRISGKILQLETVTQSKAIRRRYRYLSHFSLTTTFQLCEIDLSHVLPPGALFPFMDEIKKREKQRKQLAEKEKINAEVAVAADSLSILSNLGHSSHDDLPKFSVDDFEALGGKNAMSSSPPTSSSPPVVGGRILFSNVTRLGFAAALDSPALKIGETSSFNSNKVGSNTSGAFGTRNSGTPTFANVTSRVKSGENLDTPKINEIGKKGKKPSRVLMSTAGGRRY